MVHGLGAGNRPRRLSASCKDVPDGGRNGANRSRQKDNMQMEIAMNMGRIDRGVRALLGVALLFLPLLNIPDIWSSATLSYISMGVGLIMLATSLFGYCPLYTVLGIHTNRGT